MLIHTLRLFFTFTYSTDGLWCKYERGKSDCRIPVERLQWDDRELAVVRMHTGFHNIIIEKKFFWWGGRSKNLMLI